MLNLALAVAAIALTLRSVPALRPNPAAPRRIDLPGALLLAGALTGVVCGLSQGPAEGWGDLGVVGPIAGGIALLAAFCVVELRTALPLVDFRLFRHRDLLAANISQVLAGMVELGLGFLLPIPAPGRGRRPGRRRGRADPRDRPDHPRRPARFGGRWPLVGGYLALAASGLALGIAAGAESAVAYPGAGAAGHRAGRRADGEGPDRAHRVPGDAQGAAAGMINTSEQLGGSIARTSVPLPLT